MEFAHDIRAAEIGQLEIEDDEVGALVFRAFDHAGAGGEEAAVNAGALEVELIEFGNDDVIFGDKDSFHLRISRVMMVQSSSKCGP